MRRRAKARERLLGVGLGALVAVVGTGLHLGASLTDRLLATVESPAARCSAFAAGVLVYYSSFVLAIVLDTPPHLAFDPEVGADWRVPDDGFDPSVRRAFKASFICLFNALVALFALGNLGKQ